MIDIKDTLNLSDGKEYVVASKAEYENDIYYYLVDINEYSNIKFCKEKKTNDDLRMIELEDENLIQKLLPMFFEAGKHLLDELEQQ